ncbi:hypothetical protein PHISCL_11203 [Aspergillus sclerotialis]|uniref:Uncharacterized protein n=1 Tax=Aspergillus sclerotialis TaxID=2070753 RepID=A0A3A2Z135_9EURO|nr:hypothetical protein PHISCL_11203 [Aspergillus sclerotialis]
MNIHCGYATANGIGKRKKTTRNGHERIRIIHTMVIGDVPLKDVNVASAVMNLKTSRTPKIHHIQITRTMPQFIGHFATMIHV